MREQAIWTRELGTEIGVGVGVLVGLEPWIMVRGNMTRLIMGVNRAISRVRRVRVIHPIGSTKGGRVRGRDKGGNRRDRRITCM